MRKLMPLLALSIVLAATASGVVATNPCQSSLGCGGSPLFATGSACQDCTVYACQAAAEVDRSYYRQLNTECSVAPQAGECAEAAFWSMLFACADVADAKEDCEDAWCTGSGEDDPTF